MVMNLLFFICLILSCNGQQKSTPSIEETKVTNPKYGFNSGALDKDGNLWFGSLNGIYLFDGENFSIIDKSDGLCSNNIYTIFEDKDGILWIGTSNGLCKYDGSSFTHIPIPFKDTSSAWLDKVYPIINPNAVHAIVQDKKGNYWIGTGGGGAYNYDGNTFTSYLENEGRKYEDSLYHNWVPDLAVDNDGNIWFASMSYGGLNRFDGQNFQKYLRADGLSDDMIRKVLVGKEGEIWLGFNGNRKSALTVFNGESFYIYPLDDSSCHRNIRSMFEDKAGKLWLGGEGGVCILEAGVFKEFLDNNNRHFSGINFIVEDSEQNIWFGGRNGLWRFDGNQTIKLTK